VPLNRRVAVVFVGLSCWSAVAPAQSLAAPNVVAISPNLVTSGQPTAQSLATLSQQGFRAVIYLAPSSVSDAIRDEPELVTQQGLEFVHVPIPFSAPTEAHFEAVSTALQRLQGQKVLVHCQVNMRASTMVFLHRVIKENANPAEAWELVTRVWSPQGPWKRLALAQLSKNGIKFDPF